MRGQDWQEEEAARVSGGYEKGEDMPVVFQGEAMGSPVITLAVLLKLLVIWLCIMALDLAHVLATAVRKRG